MGLSPLMEGDAILTSENGDRSDISLPTSQVDYLERLASKGARSVLVLTGSPISLGHVEDLVQAIVFAWYPGQEGGFAVADVLFGEKPPSGKIPVTFPKKLEDLPPFEDYAMEGRTYRYATAEPLYPFGFGLSYTSFTYSDLELKSSTIRSGMPLEVSLTMINVGDVEADEVAQFYLSDLEASVRVAFQNLVGFRRLHLKPHRTRAVRFTIEPEMMMFFDDEGKQRLEPGLFRISAGGCSPSSRGQALGVPETVSATFEVTK